MNIDLSNFTPVEKITRPQGMWVRINSTDLSAISHEALRALEHPSHIEIWYSEKDDAFLITPSTDPDKGTKLSRSRQFASVTLRAIARAHGWKNQRYPAIMTEAGLLVRHYEKGTHHE